MLSLTYNTSTHPLQFYYEVYSVIQQHKNYFCKFCGEDAELFMLEAYTHALTNYNEESGTLPVYIRALARTMGKQYNKHEVFVDFNNDSYDEENIDASYVRQANKKTNDTTEDSYSLFENDSYSSLDEAFEELKEKYPIDLIYFQKAIIKKQTYTEASKDFKYACSEIIKQFPNMLDEIKLLDLSNLIKEQMNDNS